MLIIFVVETDSVCKSDSKYIDKVLEYWYKEFKGNKNNIIRYVYLCSKSRFDTKKKEINHYIRAYHSRNPNNPCIVIFCIDTDSGYDSEVLNNRITKYCCDNKYELVFFKENIEEVFWGQKFAKKEKSNKSQQFFTSKQITKIKVAYLKCSLDCLNNKKSNLLIVLDSITKKS